MHLAYLAALIAALLVLPLVFLMLWTDTTDLSPRLSPVP